MLALTVLRLTLAASPAADGAIFLGPAATTEPRRVVSLAPSLTEIVYALDAGDRVVAVTRYDDFPPAVAGLPKVGGVDFNPERIVSLQPDLVLAIPTASARGKLELLGRLGKRVVIVPAQDLEDVFAAIEIIGAALQRTPAAARLVQRVRADLDSAAGPKRAKTPPRVLLAVGRKPLVGVGPGAFLDALLARAQTVNVLTTGGAYPVLDLEAMSRLRPDVVIDVSLTGSNGFWQEPLVRAALGKARLVELHSSALLRPGPRVGEALRLLATAAWGDAP